MSARRLGPAGVAALAQALADPQVVARYAAKVVLVPGTDCAWWTGAISGRGHGRFWFGGGRAVVAHRFAFGLAYGVERLDAVRVLGHRCDNPLCQRVSGDDDVARRRARAPWGRLAPGAAPAVLVVSAPTVGAASSIVHAASSQQTVNHMLQVELPTLGRPPQ